MACSPCLPHAFLNEDKVPQPKGSKIMAHQGAERSRGVVGGEPAARSDALSERRYSNGNIAASDAVYPYHFPKGGTSWDDRLLTPTISAYPATMCKEQKFTELTALTSVKLIT
jgi:hypothetical protein